MIRVVSVLLSIGWVASLTEPLVYDTVSFEGKHLIDLLISLVPSDAQLIDRPPKLVLGADLSLAPVDPSAERLAKRPGHSDSTQERAYLQQSHP
jgi:hypothetical protein